MQKIVWLLLFLSLSFSLLAQPATQAEKKNVNRIELKGGAKSLLGDIINGQKVRILDKDSLRQIEFWHEQNRMFCDSAAQFVEFNQVETYRNIRLIDADSTVITGDTLFYDGNSRLAKLRGNVILVDKDKTIITNKMDYNLNTRVAYYFDGGLVKDSLGTTLNSRKGYYNTRTKVANFRGNVVYNSPDTYLESDSLTYHTAERIVYFDAPTRIKTRDGILHTEGGMYNTVLGTSVFEGRSKIDNKDYTITADKLDYDKILEKGIAEQNVEFYLKKEKITIRGDLAKYDGFKGKSEVFGHGLMLKPNENGKDTLFLAADTLIYLSDSLEENRRLLAYPKVKIFRKDFQALCDSLYYSDSLIRFYKNPIIWANQSQLSADTIFVNMKDNQINEMKLRLKSFIISQDTVRNFNQIKGKFINAKFAKNELHKIYVNGNGESVFHALKNDTLSIGINRIRCGDMIFSFNDSSKLRDILFINQPDGKFIPPQKLTEKEKYLDDFTWRIIEKPSKGVVLGVHHSSEFVGKNWKNALQIADEEFDIFKKDNELLFVKAPAQDFDTTAVFELRVFPKNKDDIEIQLRKNGYQSLFCRFESLDLKREVLEKLIELPKFEIQKLQIRRLHKKEALLWEKLYTF